MKGIVFTEFMELVESMFGADTLDAVIAKGNLPNAGAYTAVGTYDHGELVRMVVALSEITSTPVPTLIHAYGKHLFGRFVAGFPRFFVGVDDAFDFLGGIDGYIHVEVRKLYPDAELPRFEAIRHSPDALDLIYRSQRPFADLAAGLIDGCLAHYGVKATVERTPLAAEAGVTPVRFSLRRTA
jgi:hypothetical protein